jgi:transcriptional regulator with XRE-family HTH domain
MNTEMQTQIYKSEISNYALLIKKMRLLRKLDRRQAAILFEFSYKNIEKLENGRGQITVGKFKLFQNRYGFSDKEIQDILSGKLPDSDEEIGKQNQKINDGRKNRRFCHRQISRECRVLKELRLLKNLDQVSASKLCGFGKNTIGFIENGRISLTEKRILHIVMAYGQTMELFNQLLKLPQLRHEMVNQCNKLISTLDDNKLRIVLPMLQSMST